MWKYTYNTINFEYSKVPLEAVNKPFYGFRQYMCNSVEVVKKCRSGKCLIGLTHCPHLPDLLSDRQERDFDSSGVFYKLTQKPVKILRKGFTFLKCRFSFLLIL
jgi:hypothetical protein